MPKALPTGGSPVLGESERIPRSIFQKKSEDFPKKNPKIFSKNFRNDFQKKFAGKFSAVGSQAHKASTGEWAYGSLQKLNFFGVTKVHP